MKWLVDAQLPFGLVILLRQKGWNILHTNNLPLHDQTPDSEIRRICAEEQRILITKDSDFQDSFYVNRSPSKLLVVTTGNIKNTALYALFETYADQLEEAFLRASLVELSTTAIVVHE